MNDMNQTGTKYVNTATRTVKRLLKISCHSCLQKLDVTTLPSFSRINCPSCGAELIVPMWFDQYLLEEPGGLGGMATVYRALDPALDREVAIKVLKNELANTNERTELFLHEARTAATVNHYAVIPIFTCGVFEGQAYIVMQYMAGGSLENKLNEAKGHLNVRSVARWMRDVADGLANARQHGIIHHDIKPANIMLDADGNAKIGDFGLAQAVNTSNSDRIAELTRTWVTPHYVSPEKALNGTEDYKGDIYSLGATFYHLATGFLPFSNADIDELIRMRLDHPPMPPMSQRRDINENISNLILSMMAVNPEDRPDYTTITAYLNSYLNEGTATAMENIPKPTIRHTMKKGDSAEKSESVETLTQPEQKKSRGGIIFIAFAFLILILAAGGGALYYFNPQFVKDTIEKLKSLKDASSNTNTSVKPDGVTDNDIAHTSEKIINSGVTASFSTGNAEAALDEAQLIFDNEEMPQDARAQAALQLAYAIYLNADEDNTSSDEGKDSPATLASDILYLANKRFTPDELKQFNDNIQILRYLSGTETNPDKLNRWDVELNGADFKAKKLLAILLYKIHEGTSDDKTLRTLLASLEIELNKLPDYSQLQNAFLKNRVPVWKKILSTKKGVSSETEKCFRKYILFEELSESEREARDAALSSTSVTISETPDIPIPKETTSNIKKDEDLVDKENLPVVTVETLREARSKYANIKRPAPKSPFDFLTQAKTEAYIGKLPPSSAAAETKRIDGLMNLKGYIIAVSGRNPYHLESFRDIAGTSHGEGTFMFREQDIFYKKDDTAITMEWNKLSYKTVADILKYYADYRAEAVVGRFVKKTDRIEQAKAYIRLALLAHWYGDDTLASEALTKALELAPYKQVCNAVKSLFLS